MCYSMCLFVDGVEAVFGSGPSEHRVEGMSTAMLLDFGSELVPEKILLPGLLIKTVISRPLKNRNVNYLLTVQF